jgi:Ser/Thr protein kinase RdoA (MazF antagonist)
MNDLLSIAGRFAVTGVPWASESHAEGHINDTWFIDTDERRRYVLQRINPHVFADPAAVAENTARVVAHIRGRTTDLVPPFVAARDGTASVNVDGSVYRMLGYVAGRSLDGLETSAQAESAGAAFGAFQQALADYDRTGHQAPIPHFHELDLQLRRLDEVLAAPRAERHREAANEIALAQRYRAMVVAEDLGPFGMIHGDGKVTNLIFEAASDRIVAVLDLDTVMWGALSWDFGDLVRSAAALGAEDDPNLEFSLERFGALCGGYVRGAGDLVDAPLRAALATAPAYMTYMLALRFLIDYLNGDPYFRVAYADHNLIRARCQLRLFGHMTQMRRELNAIVAEV